MRIAGAIVWACLGAAAAGAADRPADRGPLAKLDPFYKQHVLVDGLLIASSETVRTRGRSVHGDREGPAALDGRRPRPVGVSPRRRAGRAWLGPAAR